MHEMPTMRANSRAPTGPAIPRPKSSPIVEVAVACAASCEQVKDRERGKREDIRHRKVER